MRRLAIAAAMVLTASISWAHLPVGKVWPAVQFPDGKTPAIDGNLVDWDVIPSPYWITHEDLTETVIGVGTAFDATDLALRAIVGWNDSDNKVYIMEDRFDNAIWVTTGWEPMEFEFDADHSGGMFGVWPDVTDQEQKDRLHGAQGQDYGFNQGGPGLNAWHKAQWHYNLPWGQFAKTQTAAEGGEGFFQAEYMLTGWDDLDWHGPDTSVIHDFKEDSIIGLNLTIIDDDNPTEGGYEGYWVLSGATDSYYQGDLLSDFVLAPIDADINWGAQATAVEDQTWGRIKSTFAE
ncbi:MAG: hypothetical protein EXS58_09665 [Candidatus Latescibacteria bacterium]|nr:hypothetical protein [Candidatus Latescibacterota bacterium]